MKARRKVSILAAVSFVLSLALSAVLLHQHRSTSSSSHDRRCPISEFSQVLKRASLGTAVLCRYLLDARGAVFWRTKSRQCAKLQLALSPVELTTHLDPQLVVAYQFGASFLAPPPPNGAGKPERAVQLMEYGIQNNPNDWKLYYDLGFVYYMNLKDYRKAADAFERGSNVPNAHPFMRLLAAQIGAACRRFDTARMLWSATYQNSQDKHIRANAVENLRALRVD